MEPTTIGLWVTGGMLVLVVLGMRVAFAAALAGVVGLVWIFWARKGYAGDEFLWALEVAAQTAGQVPHSKISSQALNHCVAGHVSAESAHAELLRRINKTALVVNSLATKSSHCHQPESERTGNRRTTRTNRRMDSYFNSSVGLLPRQSR